MKKFIFTLTALSVLMITGFAQQSPLFSQYNYNKFLINPAIAGMYKSPQLFLVHRDQWTNMPGNPVTNALSFETALKSSKVGLGALVYNDQLGIINNTGAMFAYSYKLRLTEESYLGLGLGVGIKTIQIRFGDAVYIDPADPLISNYATMNRVAFDASGGLNYNWKKLNIGLALPNLFNSKAKFFDRTVTASSGSYFSYARHLSMNASYEFSLDQAMNHSLTPSLLFKRDLLPGERPMQLDANLLYDYKKKYYAGMAYRTGYGMIANVGIRLFDRFFVGYAYDIPTNNAWKGKTLVGQTHEIMLGFSFGPSGDLEDRITRLDSAVKDNQRRINEVDSAVKDNKKKMDKMNNDLRKRDDENFQNLKKEIDKLNGDMDAIRKRLMGMNTDSNDSNASSDAGAGTGNYILTRIYFKSDRSELLPGSLTELDELAELMKAYPNMAIKITGHTDNRNTEAYNQKLSERRAKAVYDYLVSKGISKDRLSYEGMGMKMPIADNDTEAGMQLNRRVTFKITRF
jgi:type IX secretion system PorP/SprF family membrane protein